MHDFSLRRNPIQEQENVLCCFSEVAFNISTAKADMQLLY